MKPVIVAVSVDIVLQEEIVVAVFSAFEDGVEVACFEIWGEQKGVVVVFVWKSALVEGG